MSWANLDDVQRQLEAAGLLIDKALVADSRIQRWKTADSKGGEKPGWSRLREWQAKSGAVFVVGCFGIWQGTDDGYTKVELPRRDDPARQALTDEDIEAARAAQKAAQKAVAEERKREAKQAAAWSAQVWAKCQPAVEHEYLARKGIDPCGTRIWSGADDLLLPGIDDANHWRLKKSVGALAVPMHDVNGNVCGLQFVFPKGHEFDGKQFWPTGMAMGGTFGLIGPLRRSGVLLATEGFATAASLHLATGQSVAYAFSANNLGKAGKQIRARYKQLRLLFCADDDYLTAEKTGKNPGIDAAQLAASEIELASWVKPDFIVDGADLRAGKKLSDFNDLDLLRGRIAVADQINARLDELKWRDAAAGGGGRATPPPGGGDFAPGGGGDGERPPAMSVMSLDELVARFMPLDDGTGKYVFDTWTNRVAHRDQMAALLPAGQRGDDIKRHPVWVSRGACYLDQVGFDPTLIDPTVKLNTWRGWPMKPKAGRCERLLELLEYLCGGEGRRDVCDWVLKWMAYPLQHPGAKMNSAIIMHGPQGTGKSAVFQTYARIYGDYSTVLNQRGLEDKFNADWADSKLFILAEEVVTRQEMWHIKNELKELVTGDWIRINPKNIAAYRQRNQVNIVYLSNENQPLPIENDDRRHLVVYTPPALGEDFYDEVFLEIENGGVEAFYYYLKHLDLDGFHPKKRPPMTEAKLSLINLSLPSELRFVNDWTGGDTPWPIVPCLAADLYAAYLKWCRLNGEPRPRPSNQFHGAISRLDGWSKKKTRVYPDCHCTGQTIPKNLVIPPEGILQAAGTAKPPAEGMAEWLTSCLHQFANATQEEKWAA